MGASAMVTAKLTEAFPVLMDFMGATPRQDTLLGSATAFCAVLHRPDRGQVVVMMTDGDYGASITNAAQGILAFIAQRHLVALGVDPRAVRWIYRDTDGAWDEIIEYRDDGTPQLLIRPLGARTQADAFAVLTQAGMTLSAADAKLLCTYLQLGCDPEVDRGQ